MFQLCLAFLAVCAHAQQAPEVVIDGWNDSAERLEYFNNLLK